jgi:inner membrane protein YidH
MTMNNNAGEAAFPTSTELAMDRALLAHDRTLMAWVGTVTSMISFGFTIYKFFQYLREQQGLEPDGRVLGPRRFAMLMISIGLLSLLLATPQQLRLREKLKHIYPEAGFPLATIMAAFI